MAVNSINQDYKVIDSNDITLSLVIGEEQAGWFAVFLDGEFLVDGKTKIQNFSLGNGSDIKSKTLLIRATVLDINPDTNRTSVTYSLSGGESNLTITAEMTVDNDNDPAFYSAEFKLV